MTAAAFPPLIELPPPGRALTFEEWLGLDEDEPGELVDGRLEAEEVPDYVHEVTVAILLRLIGNWLGDEGWVVGSEAKMRLHANTGRKPDLIVHLPGTAAPPRFGALRTPPDIVVEVVTATPRDERRDRLEKRVEYARFGVRWYWLVDPALGTFEILELGADRAYHDAVMATKGIIDPVPGCPGLSIDVDRLWARLAQLGPEET